MLVCHIGCISKGLQNLLASGLSLLMPSLKACLSAWHSINQPAVQAFCKPFASQQRYMEINHRLDALDDGFLMFGTAKWIHMPELLVQVSPCPPNNASLISFDLTPLH